jgi:hypothetical protein
MGIQHHPKVLITISGLQNLAINPQDLPNRYNYAKRPHLLQGPSQIQHLKVVEL